MVSDKVLLFSGNGVLCSNAELSLLDGSLDKALLDKLDYLGTPWLNRYGEGGEGSISYRNRTAMLDVIQYFDDKDIKLGTKRGLKREKDYFLSGIRNLNEEAGKNYRVATKEQTIKFGDAEEYDGNSPPPFAAVGLFRRLGDEQREMLLSSCPELKVIFPSLHNPSCFGATPNSDECAASICALRKPEERKGGC